MSSSQSVLILGGGSGGIVAANLLRRGLPKSHRVILVDKERDHLFAPSLLWLMIGNRRPDQIARPIASIEKRGIEVVRGEIEKIYPSSCQVQVQGKTYSAAALIVALGANFASEKIPGLAESGHNAYALDGAIRIRDALHSFQGGRIVILTASPVYKCPAAPYEIAMLIEYQCRKQGIRDKVQIEVHAAEPGPMGTAGPEVSKQVRQMVESKGITYFPSHQVERADAASRELHFNDQSTVPFDLLLYVPPHEAPAVVRDSGLLSESGWIAVDRHTMETKFKNVYAIGDVTSIPLKMGRPLPKAGVFAHRQAEVVAHNLIYQWTGTGVSDSFQGTGKCFIEIGDHRAGIGSGNFYAEPAPQVSVKRPNLFWHFSKVAFEKHWLHRWF